MLGSTAINRSNSSSRSVVAPRRCAHHAAASVTACRSFCTSGPRIDASAFSNRRAAAAGSLSANSVRSARSSTVVSTANGGRSCSGVRNARCGGDTSPFSPISKRSSAESRSRNEGDAGQDAKSSAAA